MQRPNPYPHAQQGISIELIDLYPSLTFAIDLGPLMIHTKITTQARKRSMAFRPSKLPMDPMCSLSDSSKIKYLKIII